jgi:hypothetical protein
MSETREGGREHLIPCGARGIYIRRRKPIERCISELEGWSRFFQGTSKSNDFDHDTRAHLNGTGKCFIWKGARVYRGRQARACSKHWTGCCENRLVRKVPRGVLPRLEAVGRDGQAVRFVLQRASRVLAPEALVERRPCVTHVSRRLQRSVAYAWKNPQPLTGFSVVRIHFANTTRALNQSAAAIAPRAFNKGAEHATASRLSPQAPPLPRLLWPWVATSG